MRIQTQNQIEATENPVIIADRNEFTNAIEKVSDIVETRNSQAILANVLIQGFGEYATVTTSDLDMQITVKMDCAADSRFNSTIPAKKLKELTKKAVKSDFVSLSMANDSADISLDFESVKYNLNGLDANDFPHMPSHKTDAPSATFKLDGKWFIDCLLSVYDAVSTEETRYYLNGVFMEYSANDNELIFVATDGHKLFRRTIEAPAGAELINDLGCYGNGVIIPRKAIKSIMKLIKGKNTPETIEIKTSEARCDFKFDNVTVSTKLIDGNFPDYRRVIPAYNEKLSSFDAKQLIEAIDSTSLINSNKRFAVKLIISDNKCDFIVNNPESGSAETSIPCEYQGEKFQIGYSSAYLKLLAQVACPKGGNLSIKFNNAGDPAVFTSDLENWTGVLMPMRI